MAISRQLAILFRNHTSNEECNCARLTRRTMLPRECQTGNLNWEPEMQNINCSWSQLLLVCRRARLEQSPQTGALSLAYL